MEVAIRCKSLVGDRPGDFNIERTFVKSYQYEESEERHIVDAWTEDPDEARIFNLKQTEDANLVKELIKDMRVPNAWPLLGEFQVVGIELVLTEEIFLDNLAGEDDEGENLEHPIEPTSLRLVKQENPV